MHRRIDVLIVCSGILLWLACGSSPSETGRARSGNLFVHNDLTDRDVEVTVTFLNQDRLPLEDSIPPGKLWTSEEFEGGTQLRVKLEVRISGGRTSVKEITINGSIRMRVTGIGTRGIFGENLIVEIS